MNKAAIIEEIKWTAEVEGGKPDRPRQLSDHGKITVSIDNADDIERDGRTRSVANRLRCGRARKIGGRDSWRAGPPRTERCYAAGNADSVTWPAEWSTKGL
jgi:hypothetical protein